MLTPLAHETLRLFGEEAMEVPAIADATGQNWMQVRNVINVHADGHRTKAKRLLDEQKAPSREEVTAAIAAAKSKQLVEPIAKPKPPAPKPEPVAAPAEEPAVLAHIAVPLDDLDGVNDVMTVAASHPAASIRDKAAEVSEALAALRNEIIRFRRGEAVSAARARIAELEAELAGLRQMVGAAT